MHLIQKIFWLTILLLLIQKFFLTTNLNEADFFLTYKFFSPDSYDWLANGIRLFENNQISFRNPGLPLLIKVFSMFKIIHLLPLINQLIFFGIIVFVYKITLLITKRALAGYLISLALFLNYSFQNFANYILSDYYAIFFMTVSLYMFMKKRNLISLFFLGISSLFQNFALIIAPLWFICIYIYYFRKSFLLYLWAFLTPILPWYLYKSFIFGNPFYTKINQAALIQPNLNSVFFYFINIYTLFGLSFLITVLFILKNYQTCKKNSNIIFLLCCLSFTLFFWLVVYEWNDRRFLLYIIPFLYPLIGIALKHYLYRFGYISIIIFLLSTYSTTISLGNFFTFNFVPISSWNRLVLKTYADKNDQGFISLPAKIVSVPYPIIASLNPVYAEFFYHQNYNLYNYKTVFSLAKNSIDSHSKPVGITSYEFNSILLILKNQTI